MSSPNFKQIAATSGAGAAILALVMFILVMFVIGPVLLIWSFNVLFKLSIDPFFWYNWLAACVLIAVLGKSSSSSSS